MEILKGTVEKTANCVFIARGTQRTQRTPVPLLLAGLLNGFFEQALFLLS